MATSWRAARPVPPTVRGASEGCDERHARTVTSATVGRQGFRHRSVHTMRGVSHERTCHPPSGQELSHRRSLGERIELGVGHRAPGASVDQRPRHDVGHRRRWHVRPVRTAGTACRTDAGASLPRRVPAGGSLPWPVRRWCHRFIAHRHPRPLTRGGCEPVPAGCGVPTEEGAPHPASSRPGAGAAKGTVTEHLCDTYLCDTYLCDTPPAQCGHAHEQQPPVGSPALGPARVGTSTVAADHDRLRYLRHARHPGVHRLHGELPVRSRGRRRRRVRPGGVSSGASARRCRSVA